MSEKKITTVVKSSKRGASKGERRGGRIAGTPNKSTSIVKEALGSFLDGNIGRLNDLLDEIYKQFGPLVTFNCITDLVEFNVPKLARTEHTGAEGGPIETCDQTDREILEMFLKSRN